MVTPLLSAFPPGTHDKSVFAASAGVPGTLWQSNPTCGSAFTFLDRQDDGNGHYLNELDINNTLDPSPYLGFELNAKILGKSEIPCASFNGLLLAILLTLAIMSGSRKRSLHAGINPTVSIQQNALGLYTGIIQTKDGTILIDSPYRTDEPKNWGSRTGKSEAIFLVLLDTQYDRTLSAKGCDCIVVSQSDYLLPAKPRQQAVKLQEELLGAGDSHEMIGSTSRPFHRDQS